MDRGYVQNQYSYKIYGLYIESNYEIEEFIKVDKVSNYDKVVITKGTISEKIKELINQGNNFGTSKEEIWFNINNTAIYQICNGNRIAFEIYENADLDLVKGYLMCSCLGFIMIQREKLAIHGGCVVINDRGVIITGDRGAGKSTLTTALRLKGYKFLSDDVAAISDENNAILVDYGFPYQKLCVGAMDNFKYESDKYKSIMGDTEMKYMIPVYDDFIKKNVQLEAIFKLSCEDVDDVYIEEIRGVKKLNSIISSIYRGEFFRHIEGMSSAYIGKCIEIAKNIKFYKIIRPKNEFSINKQIKLLENKLNMEVK